MEYSHTWASARSGVKGARVGATPRRLTLAEFDRLCSAFLRLPGMRDSTSRNLYIDALSRQLSNSLTVQRYLDPHHDVWSLLQACQEHIDGIQQLATVVRTFHRGSRAMRELDELIECMFPDEFLGHLEREELLTLLADVEPGWLRRACRYAAPTAWQSESVDWSDPASVVHRLESRIGTPGAPPPLLIFVDFVAHLVDTARSAEHHRWIDRIGARMNVDPESLGSLCIAATSRLDDAPRFYFIVQLRPDGMDPDRYLMSVWLQHHRAVEEPLYRDDEPLTLPEMLAQLPDLLGRAHAGSGVASEMIIEFILPRSLIGDPVDQWEVDEVFPYRLGTSYPVVVRSLDRLEKTELHSSWRHKWRRLSTNGHRENPNAVYWLLEPGHRSPRSMHAGLQREDATVVVAMGYPPEHGQELTTDELTAALYAGVPVLLWCRDPRLRHEFETEIRDMLTGHGLMELPSQVLRLRQRADEEDNVRAAVGRHLTLLWDDADRIPESFQPVRLQAPR